MVKHNSNSKVAPMTRASYRTQSRVLIMKRSHGGAPDSLEDEIRSTLPSLSPATSTFVVVLGLPAYCPSHPSSGPAVNVDKIHVCAYRS